jgi:hypothetical protein
MAFLEHPKRNVTTKMTHLARDPLYLKQKPYGVDFATDTPTTNHVFEDVEVTIRDARSIKSGFSLDENGFCFLDHPTSAIFDSLKTDPSKVEDYYKEIETLIKFAFPEYSRFDIIDHLVCLHPNSVGESCTDAYSVSSGGAIWAIPEMSQLRQRSLSQQDCHTATSV